MLISYHGPQNSRISFKIALTRLFIKLRAKSHCDSADETGSNFNDIQRYTLSSSYSKNPTRSAQWPQKLELDATTVRNIEHVTCMLTILLILTVPSAHGRKYDYRIIWSFLFGRRVGWSSRLESIFHCLFLLSSGQLRICKPGYANPA